MTTVYLVGHINKLKVRMDANIINCFDYVIDKSTCCVKYCEINYIQNLKYDTDAIFILLPNAFDKETTSESKDIIKNMTNGKCLFFEDLKCKCGYKCDGTNTDCEWNKWYNENIVPYNFNCLISRYRSYIPLALELKHRVHYFPHLLNINIFDRKDTKEVDILFYGNHQPDFYPFRHRLYFILKNKNNNKLKDLRVRIIDHPGWGPKSKRRGCVGQKLYTEINNAWLTVCTKAIHNALLAKYIETVMGGSVILGDYPDIDDCFRDNMVYIHNDMTDDDIMDKIIDSINDKTTLNKFIYNNNAIAHRFSLEACINIFDSIVGSISDGK